MASRKQEISRTDELLDELLLDCQGPEDILGETGLLKQLSQRLIERALARELSHHLKVEARPSEIIEEPERVRGVSKILCIESLK